ncbi:MAG: succinate CoA transferase [Desulfobacteraceae bacterium]|nr:succinate CoA transferase [Desulfobacteraceae bacterium]
MFAGTFPIITAEEAASHIPDGAMVALSGFANAGTAKLVPRAIAKRARSLHEKGKSYKIRLITGSSSGNDIDEDLAQAEAISWRAPYQNARTLRQQINSQQVQYLDMHLSHAPQTLLAGFFGKLDYAIVEASDITRDGRVYLTTSIGATPTYLKYADRIFIEINAHHSKRLPEMADIVLLQTPPRVNPIPIHDPLARIGYPYAVVDPKKIIGIIETNEPDMIDPFAAPDWKSNRIADHVVRFLFGEMIRGHIPREFLPLQAGVGNLGNSVMAELGNNPYIPPFTMYSVTFQDSLVDLMEKGKLLGASASSLTVTPETLTRICTNMDFFGPRIVLRPQEISDDTGVIRRLGIIAINPALEVDIYGNVNSSHIFGTDIMNGIGGSGEFTRNSYLSIIMCPSTTLGGKVSCVVPMCPHIDSNEHSVQVIVTEQGYADLRGLGPMQRAKKIIENCAHPAYRDYLHAYIRDAKSGHIRHDLKKAYELHRNFLQYGQMLPDLNLAEIGERI